MAEREAALIMWDGTVKEGESKEEENLHVDGE